METKATLDSLAGAEGMIVWPIELQPATAVPHIKTAMTVSRRRRGAKAETSARRRPLRIDAPMDLARLIGRSPE
jgi:hypothetical protein